ncbi:MAG: serine/threonine-protein kinase [Propionibacteriales bacterium]|nr:serine/threonine-protein kinase [Propionibacteriales bacterium]
MGNMPGPGDTFGRYQVEAALGQGGMGVVLTAVHLDLGRRVALKLLAPQLVGADDMVARFRREAQALARLDSPHVVQVYDTGAHDGWLYIATQLIPDGDLTELVQRRGALPAAEALALVDQVLSGLADAHAVGLIHRDVKPSNVLLRNEAAGVRAFLCDFGIAQALDVTNVEKTQGVIGTWAYLAPERFDGHPATAQADLYATGCLLWFLVTATLPYEGTMVQQAVAHQTLPVRQLPGGDAWSHAVNQLLLRSMAKDPADRFSSAQEMQAFLRSATGVAKAGGSAADSGDVGATTVVALPPMPAPPGRTVESTRAKDGTTQEAPRRRGLRITAVVAVVVLLAGAVAGALAAGGLFQSEDEPTTARKTDGSSGPTTDATVVAQGPHCWSDPTTVVASLDQCLPPTGVNGLKWVFPSIDDDCTDVKKVDETINRPELHECLVTLADGSEVKVNYSQWNSASGGREVYDRDPDLTPGPEIRADGKVAFHQWSGIGKGLFKYARTYADYAFGFTIYTTRADQAQQAIDQGLVSWREPAEVRGSSN